MTQRFILPSETTKIISVNTLKIYKSKLNKLANNGFNSVDSLIQNQIEVINLINNMVNGDEDKHRQEKRLIYSAIFFVLPQEVLAQQNEYYFAFQKAKQNYSI